MRLLGKQHRANGLPPRSRARSLLLTGLLIAGLANTAVAQEQFSLPRSAWDGLSTGQRSSGASLAQPQTPVRQYYPDGNTPQGTAGSSPGNASPPWPGNGDASPASPTPQTQLQPPPHQLPAPQSLPQQQYLNPQQHPQPPSDPTAPQPPTVRPEHNTAAAVPVTAAKAVVGSEPAAAAKANRGALPLTRPGTTSETTTETPARRIGSTSSQLGTTVAVLVGIVVALLIGARLLKRHVPQFKSQQLPDDVLDVLGKQTLDQRHTIHFVRAGSRILILGSSLEGLRTLSEITDPVEIDRICGQCQTSPGESPMTRSFRFLLSRSERGDQAVTLDQQHRSRQQQRPQPQRSSLRESLFSPRKQADYQADYAAETDSGISQEDIAELTRTLEAARERHA